LQKQLIKRYNINDKEGLDMLTEFALNAGILAAEQAGDTIFAGLHQIAETGTIDKAKLWRQHMNLETDKEKK
jgi:hypothetical protein